MYQTAHDSYTSTRELHEYTRATREHDSYTSQLAQTIARLCRLILPSFMPYPSFFRASNTFEHVKKVLISTIVSVRHKTHLSAGLTCTNNFRSSDSSRV